ncbi:MAG: elongation factor P--(R)-beta-lysine ligase [Pseudomonadota bacterium]
MNSWRPSAELAVLRQRAQLLAELRDFFAARDVMEVETPVLYGAGATDPQLASFSAEYHGPGAPSGRTLYLQTSPEFTMKRLLAAGSGPIYQISKAFRNGEAGRRHNPEFTMLEWYRPGWDHHALMDEVEALIRQILVAPAAARVSYGDLCLRYLGIDPHGAELTELRDAAAARGITAPVGLGDDRDGWLDFLWSHGVEPRLGGDGRPVFVIDYPASLAMLARLRPGSPAVAERFELYLHGVELANGFHELADGGEQRRRFEQDNARRRGAGLPAMPFDEHLLAALMHGLPDCGGVALGVDRLLMLRIGAQDIGEVLAFPWDRC